MTLSPLTCHPWPVTPEPLPIKFQNLKCSCNRLVFWFLPSAFAGATLAFINLYDVLKGDFNVLNEFWVEILIALVKNLFSSAERDCNNEVTRKALRYIERIVYENSEIFIQVRKEFIVRVRFQNFLLLILRMFQGKWSKKNTAALDEYQHSRTRCCNFSVQCF